MDDFFHKTWQRWSLWWIDYLNSPPNFIKRFNLEVGYTIIKNFSGRKWIYIYIYILKFHFISIKFHEKNPSIYPSKRTFLLFLKERTVLFRVEQIYCIHVYTYLCVYIFFESELQTQNHLQMDDVAHDPFTLCCKACIPHVRLQSQQYR